VSPAAARVVIWSIGVYRLLLAALPDSFRRTYGPPMGQVFRTLCVETYRQEGAGGVLRLWPATLRDVAQTALTEARASLGRAAVQGQAVPAGMVGGVLLALALVAFQDALDGGTILLLLGPLSGAMAGTIGGVLGTKPRMRAACRTGTAGRGRHT
jgi:hypothetical protein